MYFVIAIAAALVLFNVITICSLLSIHPRRKRTIVILAILGNVMWVFFPLLRTLTPAGRWTRAVFGPPWFAWNSFAILYAGFVLIWSAVAMRPLFIRLPKSGGMAAALQMSSRIVLALGVVASLAGMYEALIPLRIERVPITIANLPAAAEGTRIVVLGDLHVGLFTRSSRLRQFFETTRELKPDLVILAGDLVDDDPYFAPKLLAATRFLDSPQGKTQTPLLAVLGNHEMYGDPLGAIAALRGSRIHLLVNEGVEFRSLWIAGISDYAAQQKDLRPDISRALHAAPPGTLPILIAHQPKAFDEARARHIALTLVAHTHGGQLGIRPLGWSLAGLFLPYHMGWYQRGASQLYVNTGTGFWLVPFRLGMTGEITVIELHTARLSTQPH
jgi:uncharacterized protein